MPAIQRDEELRVIRDVIKGNHAFVVHVQETRRFLLSVIAAIETSRFNVRS
jgi:hypothetical protein